MKATYFLGLLILISFYWMGILYQPFLLNIAIAVLLALATTHIYNMMLHFFKRKFSASLASTLLLGLILFVPIIYFITTVVIEITTLNLGILTKMVAQFKVWIAKDLPESLQFLKPYLLEIADSDNISNLASNALDIAAKVGGKSASFVKDIFLILIFYFFTLLYARPIGDFIKDIIPLNPGHTQNLFEEGTNVMSVVFYSILVTAIFEGALFALIAGLFGYDIILFGILYGFASLIPVIGSALLWLPLSLYELSLGHVANAIIITVYTIVVISVVADTFIKPIIIKMISDALIKSSVKINELIIFFAILAGLTTFGFWGMIIGPAITSFFISLMKLYRDTRHTTGTKEPSIPVA